MALQRLHMLRVLPFVCCSYLKRAFKTSTDLYSTLKQSRSTKRDLRRRGLFRFGSSIGIACLIDSCAELFMESFCLLINLWMVFGANNPIDMVLNSLAIEFNKDFGVLQRYDHDDCLNRLSDNEFCSFFMYSSGLLTLSKSVCFIVFDFIATMFSCFARAQMALTHHYSRRCRNEYPGVIVTIEERLRVKSKASRDNFLSPLENACGKHLPSSSGSCSIAPSARKYSARIYVPNV